MKMVEMERKRSDEEHAVLLKRIAFLTEELEETKRQLRQKVRKYPLMQGSRVDPALSCPNERTGQDFSGIAEPCASLTQGNRRAFPNGWARFSLTKNKAVPAAESGVQGDDRGGCIDEIFLHTWSRQCEEMAGLEDKIYLHTYV